MDVVGDDELLYRRMPFDPERSLYYLREPDGTIRVSSSAFSDRNRRISVDRAALNSFDPSKTQQISDDGVISLLTSDLRAITVATNDKDGKPLIQHLIDVIPVPLPDNHAHAEIVASPEIVKDNTFRRVREHLARLAKWKIYPLDCRPHAPLI